MRRCVFLLSHLNARRGRETSRPGLCISFLCVWVDDLKAVSPSRFEFKAMHLEIDLTCKGAKMCSQFGTQRAHVKLILAIMLRL